MVHASSTKNVGVALRQRGTPTGDRPLRACSPPSGLGRAGWAGGWGWWGAGTHRMRSSQCRSMPYRPLAPDHLEANEKFFAEA
eukprot:gene11630-biopygen7871